jgi:hypothetical protein
VGVSRLGAPGRHAGKDIDDHDYRWEPTIMGLPRRAQQLPLTAISIGLQAWERSRGLREFALRRGNEALQIAAHTPLGRLLPQQVHDDDADAEAARIVADAREATTAAPRPAPTPAPKPAPKPAPTPPPAAESEAARSVGAPGAVAHEVEEITDKLDLEAPQSRDELPIPDFDNISIGSLRARLRALSVEDLVVLRAWEEEHANRLNVITTLDNRIAKVAAPPSGTAAGNGTGAGTSTAAQTDVGKTGTDYPQEAKAAERAAEGEGGTLRI